MFNKNINFKTFFGVGNILALVVIIIGIIISLILDDMAIKIIGVCIACLGAIALFMQISQRLSDIVDEAAFKKKPIKEYKVTTSRDEQAVRTTVENFDYKFGEDDLFDLGKKDNIKNDEQTVKVTQPEINSTKNIDPNFNKITPTPSAPSTQYQDSFSSVRIIGKFKAKDDKSIIEAPKENEPIANIIENNTNKTDFNLFEQPITKTETVTIKPKIEPITEDKTSKITEPIITIIEEVKEIIEENTLVEKKENIQQIIEKPSEKTSDCVDYPTHYFFEKDLLIGNEPRLEFEYFVSRILLIIKSVTDSNSVLLLLVDNKCENISIEAFTTEKNNKIETKKMIPLSNDIISQIVKNAKPEILSEINPSAIKDLVPYYSDTENEKIQSFIGIPVIWNDKVIGVLCADSLHTSSFDSATVSFMGQFTKLISGLVKNYTHKIDLLEASKTLEVITKLQNIVNSDGFTIHKLYEDIITDLKKIFKDYTCGIGCFDFQQDKWLINIYDDGQKKLQDIEIDFNNSLIAKSIIDANVVYLTGLDLVNLKRVHSKEQKFLSGEFLATPLKTHNGVYGVLFIESTPHEQLTEFDISVMQVLSNHIATTLERINLINLYQSSCIVDRMTGVYNQTAFYMRMREELERMRESTRDESMALCLFKLDEYKLIDPNQNPERYELAINKVIQIAKTHIKMYEILGRMESNAFGILFLNHENSDLKKITERFRHEVANTLLEYNDEKFSTTISIGMSVYNKNSTIDDLVYNTTNALANASKQTNHVQFYN